MCSTAALACARGPAAAVPTLLGTQLSYFTGKARSYLLVKGIPFREVLATREVYRKAILPLTGVAYVPVLVRPDGKSAVQDTTEIIETLEREHPQLPPVVPPRSSPRQRMFALLVELLADEWLVMPAMHYRWSFEENLPFIYTEFGRSSAPDAPASEWAAIGQKVCRMFQNSLPALGVSEETAPAIEAQFAELLQALQAHLAQHRFLLGGRASLADVALMGPLYAHLFRDPVPGRLLKTQAPLVADWIERLMGLNPDRVDFDAGSRRGWLPADEQEQEQGQGKGKGGGGESGGLPLGEDGWFAGDVVPPTLDVLVRFFVRDCAPYLRATAERVAEYVQNKGLQDGDELPRGIGATAFTLGGSVPASGVRAVLPYPLWMLQRAADCYAEELDSQQQERVREWLARAGGQRVDAAYMVGLNPRECGAGVARVNNRIVVARSRAGGRSGPAAKL